jgi:hypothetical protein
VELVPTFEPITLSAGAEKHALSSVLKRRNSLTDLVEGYVYVFAWPSKPGFFKIGSSRVSVRADLITG